MSYFKLSTETLEKWTSTRKGPQKIGSKFIHPGIYATKNFQTDSLWFSLAAFIEILTLLVALFLTGLNPFIIVGAVFAVIFDFVFALKLHSGERNINKYRCKQEIISYEEKIHLIDNATLKLHTENFNRTIEAWNRKKSPFKILLLIIAIFKAGFTFLALIPFGILAYLVPALYFLAAYIHIHHTGFWNAHRAFKKASRKEEAIFHMDVAKGQRNVSKYFIPQSDRFQLEKLPSQLKIELENEVVKINKMSNDEKNKLKVDVQNQNDINSKDIIVTGKITSHKLIYNEDNQEFKLSFWGNILDKDLFELINKCGLSEDMKSFLCYTTLNTAQKFDDPKLPNEK